MSSAPTLGTSPTAPDFYSILAAATPANTPATRRHVRSNSFSEAQAGGAAKAQQAFASNARPAYAAEFFDLESVDHPPSDSYTELSGLIAEFQQKIFRKDQEIEALKEVVKFYFSVHGEQLRKDFPQIYRKHMKLLGIEERKDGK